MARKIPKKSASVEIHKLSPDDIDRGITKLRRRIDDIKKLEEDGVRYDDGRRFSVQSNVRDTIRTIFGSGSPEFKEFGHLDIYHGPRFVGSSEAHRQKCFLDGISFTIPRLEGLISRLEEQKEELKNVIPLDVSTKESAISSRRIFIVHGQDDAEKETTARFLEKLDLEPIILHEQPNKGRTIIEKFEDYSDVAFAVVLLTPDDLGSAIDTPEKTQPRARQNVIFELGFFIGKFGRERVCALYKGEIEILSDYQGVIFIDLDDAGAWQLKLVREIKASGIEVDMNRAL